MSVGSCRLAGNSISGRICRKLLLFLTRMGMIAVACVSKKYTTYCIAYIMHKMCSMRYSFWIQQGAVKTPKGRLVHADSIVMQSCCYQHIPQHPKGALFSWDMKRARAMGGHCHVPKTILRQCVHVKWHLIWPRVSIWIKKTALWPWRPHPGTVTSITSHITNQDFSDCVLFFRSSVIQFWWWLT